MKPHQQTRLEHHDPFGWHWHFLARFRVAASARGSLLDLKHAKIAQLDRMAVFEVFNDVIQRALNHLLDGHLGDARFFRDR